MRITIGDRLLGLRKERNANQVEVAEAVGVGRPFLSMLETGKKEPGLATLVALADYYHVSLDYLAGRSSSPISNPDDFTENEDERELVRAWKDLRDEDRAALRVLLRNARIASRAA